MATATEELRRLTLFDREAELTPESRPTWQQAMELRTKFVRYPGLKPEDLHLIHFWFLEHYGILPYYLQMQAEGILAKEVAHDEELEATWPNQVTLKFVEVEELEVRQYFQVSTDKTKHLIYGLAAPKEPGIVPLQIIHDYLLCKAGSILNPTCKYNLPAESAFLRLTHYRAVNWAHMLAGGLASAVKEYIRKFSGGTADAVMTMSWAPALLRFIKHNWGQLFGSPLNCAEAWEVYEECFGSYEQADVLWVVHSSKAAAKDALPRLMRLKPEARVENAPPEAPTQTQPRKRWAPGPTAALAREIQQVRRPTRSIWTILEPDMEVLPSSEREVQEQPPRKEPRIEQTPPQDNQRPEDAPPADTKETIDKDAPIAFRCKRVESRIKDVALTIGELRGEQPPGALTPASAIPTVGGATKWAPQPTLTLVEKALLDRLAKISWPEAMSGTAKEDQAIRKAVSDLALPCFVPREPSEALMAWFLEQMMAMVKHWTMEKAASTFDAMTNVWPSVMILAKFFLGQIPKCRD
ncbi:hypothetical protein R1flu_003878 [Riccia fluitans]|uniref:Uncharacterized protein n=1 Tax=Riccia fluitans TaxID=41844 RepID=A0ABD1YAF3_9MARC